MLVIFRLHDICQCFGRIHRMVQTEQIILYMIMLSISSYFVLSIRPYEAHLSTQILTFARRVLLRQNVKVHVLNRALGSQLLQRSAHGCLSFFAESLRRGGLISIQNIHILYAAGTCAGTCFRRRPRRSLLLYCCFSIRRPVLCRRVLLHM